mmetsp:Transcript_4547/g.11260  ORF Transcript_4547/g.11260 Transcript_4547/m.11260 type:complete len:232 (+) Transcript_4547:1415-2110(+)
MHCMGLGRVYKRTAVYLYSSCNRPTAKAAICCHMSTVQPYVTAGQDAHEWIALILHNPHHQSRLALDSAPHACLQPPASTQHNSSHSISKCSLTEAPHCIPVWPAHHWICLQAAVSCALVRVALVRAVLPLTQAGPTTDECAPCQRPDGSQPQPNTPGPVIPDPAQRQLNTNNGCTTRDKQLHLGQQVIMTAYDHWLAAGAPSQQVQSGPTSAAHTAWCSQLLSPDSKSDL